MKPTKMRNRQIYRAPLHARSAQLGSQLSGDLRKKYGRRSVRVAKGDTVSVVRGEYNKVSGKVASVSVRDGRIAIEGIKKEKSKGDKFDVLIHASNVVVTGLNTGDPWRMAGLEGKGRKGRDGAARRKAAERAAGEGKAGAPAAGAEAAKEDGARGDPGAAAAGAPGAVGDGAPEAPGGDAGSEAAGGDAGGAEEGGERAR